MTEYDPREVPILAELEEEFRQMVSAALTPVATATGPQREPSQWRRTARRIFGRAAVAGALAGVVGASALATKSVVRHDRAIPGPIVLQRAGGHELTLRHYRGRLCLDIAVAAAVASRCAAIPAVRDVAPLSALVASGRMVAGVAGDGVARVQVAGDGRTVEVATRPVGGPRSGGLRWFAALLPAPPRGRTASAVVVTPRHASGARAGRSVADCTLGSSASCSAARARTEHEHS